MGRLYSRDLRQQLLPTNKETLKYFNSRTYHTSPYHLNISSINKSSLGQVNMKSDISELVSLTPHTVKEDGFSDSSPVFLRLGQ